MAVEISIIIVNHNTCQLLEECLLSVRKNAGAISYELIVVDNNSTDGSREMIHKKYQEIEAIFNNQNLGFARGCNQGIRKSCGRYLLLLNSDTELLPGALEKIIMELDRIPPEDRIGIVGTKILNPDGSLQYSYGNFPNLRSTFIDTLRPYHKRKYILYDYEIAHEVDWVTGACMIIDRRIIEDVGYMDENYFLYYEETDWCFQAKKRGWKVFYYPITTIIHKTPHASKKGINERVATEIRRSHLYYYRKNYGYPSFVIISFLTLIYLVLKILFGVTKDTRKKSSNLFFSVWSTFLRLARKKGTLEPSGT